MKKTLVILFSVLLLAIAGCSSSSNQQASNGKDSKETSNAGSEEKEKSNFPEKPITLIVPYAPGGDTDRIGRTFAKAVQKYLPNNQSVVVENKPGGSSTVGLTSLYNAEPDGYTLSLTLQTGLAVKTHTDNLEYDWDSFEEIMTLVESSQLLVVRADAPWETFDEWLDYVKNNPGEFKYGNSGIGSLGHLTMEELKLKTGIDIVSVPYNGAGESKQALIAGETDGDIGSPNDLDPELRKPLVNLTSGEGSSKLDVPSLADYGINIGARSWFGLVTTPGVPEDRLTILHDAFKKTLEDPEVLEVLDDLYLVPYYNGPEEFENILEERYNTIGEILKDSGILG